MTRRTLDELEGAGPLYRPTQFWSPGLERLLDDMRQRGLASFKSWPSALFWFYPVYGRQLRRPLMSKVTETVRREAPPKRVRWVREQLNGTADARRDFDIVRVNWDQERWPFDLESRGESGVGSPPQEFHLTGKPEQAWTKPYLNYLLCLSALSRHVEVPPRSFLELGGGFGVLGEIVLSRDPEARYVGVDIPPLLTVASYYLTELFGDDRMTSYDEQVPAAGPVRPATSLCLPSWRLPDLEGDFDVFVNSYSFQEMEPHVVENYLDQVRRLGVRYVVSLNSRQGKVLASADNPIGVVEQVTSQRIVDVLQERGYRLLGRYNSPVIRSSGEIVVLERTP